MKIYCHILLILGLCLISFQAKSQFTYFNQVTGEEGDEISEGVTNVEVMEDGYVVFGGGVDSGNLFEFIRKYDFDGNIVLEKYYEFPNSYIYTGYSESFQKLPDESGFLFVQARVIPDNTVGFAIGFDNNLDTLWTRNYDFYPPYTNIFHFAFEEDGIIVCGSNSTSDDDEDIFLMKCDYEGNELWSVLVSEEDEQFERCIRLLPIDEGYLIAGQRFFPSDPIIKRTDFLGEEEWELNQFEEEWDVGGIFLTESNEGEFVGVTTITTETIGLQNYRHPLIFKVNIDEPSYYWKHEFSEHNLLNSGAGDIMQTSDGGFIFLGQYGNGIGNWFSYLLKVNSEGEEEWYNEYFFSDGSQCVNLIQDIELAPDGGYICAGYFEDWANDPYRKTWLFKVDACGDVEW